MSLTFYTSPMSTATITDLVVAELAVPCERVVLDIRKGETKKPEFLKLNPNGRVPLLVHDGTPIFESAAITCYLGELYGTAKGLWPASGTKRGEAMKWVVWSNVTLGDAVGRWMRNTTDWAPADQKNAAAGEAGKKDMMELLGILDAALADRPFLTGDTYTLADTHVNSFVDWLRYSKVDLAALKNVTKWGERCAARPAYQKVMSQGQG